MAQDLGSLEKVLRLGEGRRLKRLQAQAEYVASLEPDFEQLSDEELAAKTAEFKQRYENGETLEEMLFEAYAAVREAFKRTIGVRLFDVQVMGGIVLHEGDIAEMKTGEGKTFVATQPLYYDFARVTKRLRAVPHDPLRKGEAEDADFEYDEKHKTIAPTQSGVEKFERALGVDNLYDPRNSQLVNHMIQALKAQALFHRDKDYVIQDGEVKI